MPADGSANTTCEHSIAQPPAGIAAHRHPLAPCPGDPARWPQMQYIPPHAHTCESIRPAGRSKALFFSLLFIDE